VPSRLAGHRRRHAVAVRSAALTPVRTTGRRSAPISAART
jgi:hypothetical protein